MNRRRVPHCLQLGDHAVDGGQLRIIDQVGIGDLMVPEHLNPGELEALASALAPDSEVSQRRPGDPSAGA